MVGLRPYAGRAHRAYDHRLQFLHVRGGAIVQDDNVKGELPHLEVFVRGQNLGQTGRGGGGWR